MSIMPTRPAPPAPRIFLDMDDVLCGFVEGVFTVFGVDTEAGYKAWADAKDFGVNIAVGVPSETEFWTQHIDPIGETFWHKLIPHPWHNDLWDLCASIAPVTVLSAPNRNPACLAGKLRWLHDWKGEDFRDYIFTKQKFLLAAPGRILIDDRESNCQEFRQAGGEAIVFPRHWNSRRKWKDRPFEYVKAILTGNFEGLVSS